MIRQLSIQGLALIDRLAISFSPGFNVITGETGAGKSILIRALQFVLGGKVGPETIRAGSPSATVTAEFLVPLDHEALARLDELGIAYERDSASPKHHDAAVRATILVRRQITQKGRSMAWINDVSVTLPTLKELGATLVDIFGQHENQRLLAANAHTRYLDRFLADATVLPAFGTAWESVQNEVRAIETLVEERSRADRDGDYLEFRLKKLDEFNPAADDYRDLKAYCEQAEAGVSSRDRVSRALACLDAEDGAGSIADRAREAAKILQPLQSEGLAPEAAEKMGLLVTRLESLFQEAEDLHFELSRVFEASDFDPQALEDAQSRLFGYEELFRRHGVRDIEGLIEEQLKLEQRMALQKTLEEQAFQIARKLAHALPQLMRAAENLTGVRTTAARAIEGRVVQELSELSMKGARFGIAFAPVERSWDAEGWLANLRHLTPEVPPAVAKGAADLARLGREGAERAQFLLAANPGEPLLPLDKIASGGELSRILLALKKAIATDADTCVLVFDEIDTGVSGRVADAVGKKIRVLSESFQVICISHLAQVAVYADCHLRVQKNVRDEGTEGSRTETSIEKLDEKQSIEEIAKLLSAGEVSTPSLANARNLIQKARGKGRGDGASSAGV